MRFFKKPIQQKPYRNSALCLLLILAFFLLAGCTKAQPQEAAVRTLPEYAGEPSVAINGNVPSFSESDMTTESFEHYSDLDALGRCGVAYACIGRDLMPTEEIRQREFSSLLKIKDNFPKYVLSMDEVDFSRDGIRHCPISEFLLRDTL